MEIPGVCEEDIIERVQWKLRTRAADPKKREGKKNKKIIRGNEMSELILNFLCILGIDYYNLYYN